MRRRVAGLLKHVHACSNAGIKAVSRRAHVLAHHWEPLFDDSLRLSRRKPPCDAARVGIAEGLEPLERPGLTLRVAPGQIEGLPLVDLDKELTGMSVGDVKQVTVDPEEGYGPVDPAAFTEVPLSELPEDAREPGTELMSRDPSGRTQRLRVHNVEGDKATLDFNHPLAGKTLIFDIKIIDVQ